MKLLVTGGAGFIGSNFIRYIFANAPFGNLSVINLDKLTYAGNLENLKDLEHDSRYIFVRGDICNPAHVEQALTAAGTEIDAIINFAAESHVDRSIEDPSLFLRTNLLGTQTLLDGARRHKPRLFIQVSTDEVYGSLSAGGAFTEETALAPSSPYSASKAGADLLVQAYAQTYGLPICITRCSNNYGPYQFPEKLIPLMIANAMEDGRLPVYGDGMHVRDWIFVEDHCRGILAVLQKGVPGEVYNFGGWAEKTNLDVVREILRLLGKPERLLEFVPDRPGHDRRYAMNTTKAEQVFGWAPEWTFDRGLEATVSWYLANADWVTRIRSGAYQEYYQKLYAHRQDWMRGIGLS